MIMSVLVGGSLRVLKEGAKHMLTFLQEDLHVHSLLPVQKQPVQKREETFFCSSFLIWQILQWRLIGYWMALRMKNGFIHGINICAAKGLITDFCPTV